MTETHVRYVDLFDAAGMDLDGNGTCSPDERSICDYLAGLVADGDRDGAMAGFVLEHGRYWKGSPLGERTGPGTQTSSTGRLSGAICSATGTRSSFAS